MSASRSNRDARHACQKLFSGAQGLDAWATIGPARGGTRWNSSRRSEQRGLRQHPRVSVSAGGGQIPLRVPDCAYSAHAVHAARACRFLIRHRHGVRTRPDGFDTVKISGEEVDAQDKSCFKKSTATRSGGRADEGSGDAKNSGGVLHDVVDG